MKYLSIILFLVLLGLRTNCLRGQSIDRPHTLNLSNSNHKNVYDGFNNIRDVLYRSTVRLVIKNLSGGSIFCTGTLLNVNTNRDDLLVNQYVLTSRHCFFNERQNILTADYGSEENKLIFNYVSPTGHNPVSTSSLFDQYSNLPLSNSGNYAEPSKSNSSNQSEYLHLTGFNVVSWNFWGDFLLLKLTRPVPPHFRPYFAGWNPQRLILPFPVVGVASGQIVPLPPYLNVHHPRGDIMKASQTNLVVSLTNPIATGCNLVTKVVDVLFGWIWRRRVSTQVVCNYVDNPWMQVGGFNRGSSPEDGSSGSGLFSANNKLFGILSGGVNLDHYTKFKNNYFMASVKGALNPENKLLADEFGVEGREITCYKNLSLEGYYFPAYHIKEGNSQVVLTAQEKIKSVPPNAGDLIRHPGLTIIEGADYVFEAAESITLEDGFSTQPNAKFEARITSTACNNPFGRVAKDEGFFVAKLSALNFPKSLKFDSTKYSEFFHKAGFHISVHPNPAPTGSTVDICFSKPLNQEPKVQMIDAIGRQIVCRQEMQGNCLRLSPGTQARGLYILQISVGNQTTHKRLVIE